MLIINGDYYTANSIIYNTDGLNMLMSKQHHRVVCTNYHKVVFIHGSLKCVLLNDKPLTAITRIAETDIYYMIGIDTSHVVIYHKSQWIMIGNTIYNKSGKISVDARVRSCDRTLVSRKMNYKSTTQ